MIIKFYELKNKINQYKFFLLYGNNTGLIEETIENILKPNLSKNIFNYEESEIINNSENFKGELLNKSFFDNEKLIIISRVSDKIFNILDDILNKKINDISFILISGALKKSQKLEIYLKNQILLPAFLSTKILMKLLVQFLKIFL